MTINPLGLINYALLNHREKLPNCAGTFHGNKNVKLARPWWSGDLGLHVGPAQICVSVF